MKKAHLRIELTETSRFRAVLSDAETKHIINIVEMNSAIDAVYHITNVDDLQIDYVDADFNYIETGELSIAEYAEATLK